jgi:hypothetical protein
MTQSGCEALGTEKADVIAGRNKQQSPLLRLPGGLRNIVYDFGFFDIGVSSDSWILS